MQRIYISIIFGVLFIANIQGFAQVRLPRLISDGMVLQRNVDVKIWGWASFGEKIVVQFLGNEYQTEADTSGLWEVNLGRLEPGGPHQMVIGASNLLTINNIAIGDVWVASGQSNMELPMRRVSWVYPGEIASGNYPFIRQFQVGQTYNFKSPQSDVSGGAWVAANPENVLNFSAVAYFFARELYHKFGVPVGIINATLGGSPAEAWMSQEALKHFPDHYNELQRFKDDQLIKKIEESDRERIGAWYRELNQNDKAYQGNQPWYLPGTDTRGWNETVVPGLWKGTSLEGFNGVVWYKRTFYMTQEMFNQSAMVILGSIVDADSVFINGTFVGATGYQYPPRRYNIPAGLVKPGENTIVIRVISNIGHGGFVPDKTYAIVTNTDTLDISGPWQYQTGAQMEPLAGQTFVRWKPGGLYNAMIAPLLNFRIKGVIWYQGESNAGRAIEYRELFPAMINNWRQGWQQGDFPFLFVQLANFMEAKPQPSESGWAMLREAQLKTTSLPSTAMAVTIDIGEWNDIHPLNKKDVALRLSLAARSIAYGQKELLHSGPVFESMKIRRGRAILTFNNIGSGLKTSEGNEPAEFAIAGADGKFVWASAKIKNNKVIVSSKAVPQPVAVRYAWADNPDQANLINAEGLPASPFRTDKE